MTYLCLALLLVLAGIFYLVNRNTGVQADAALIEAARPTLDESWVCFSLQSEDDPNDVILLAYQSATHVMIVAEQQK